MYSKNTQINRRGQPKCTKGTVRTIHCHEWDPHFKVIEVKGERVHLSGLWVMGYGHTLYATPLGNSTVLPDMVNLRF